MLGFRHDPAAPRLFSALSGLALAVVLALGCGAHDAKPGGTAAEGAGTVRVAAASDLKFALDEVVTAFHAAHPGIHVTPTYGASGNFYAQLTHRAPFDVYLSADIEYPRKLIAAELADPQSEFLYGVGQIVVWAPKTSALDVEALGIAALTEPSVRKIAIANPAHAPYGRAAEAALKKLGVYDAVKDRLVLGENIAQTAQFVESGAADVGVIAHSLALAPQLRNQGQYWRVPLDAYPRLEQGGVILNWATDRKAAEQFKAYLLSDNGRAILARFGFELPGG